MFSVVYLHGFASSPQSDKARLFHDFFAKHGIRVVIPDLNLPAFRSLTLTRIVEAAEEASTGLQRVCVIGSSLGGYAATLWAQQREAEGRPLLAGMLMAPAFDTHRLWKDRLPAPALHQWRKSGELTLRGPDGAWLYGPQFPVLDFTLYSDAEVWSAMPLRLTTPLLIFHGEADQTVPVARSRDFAKDRDHVTLIAFPGSPHGLVAETPEMADKTLAFFQQADYAKPHAR